MGDFSHREFKRFLLEKDGIEVDESKKSTNEQSFHRKFKQHLIELDEFTAFGKAFSSSEAKQLVDRDLNVMSNILGKASQKVIKTMMDGVKGGRYEALDLVRGLNQGNVKRTHYGEEDFIKQLWHKVRNKFRRYSN
jgi:hypothetical protein|tara:strand:+ start:855 stop:1262 length:408 start_codon:yes stop_codon:yes gene_type:complete